jgi:Uncharacterized protein conserved in bacteria (DUF2252)
VTFPDATRQYERWLNERIPLLDSDLALKHERMSLGCFPFFRATFYRWAQLFPEVCSDEFKAPKVLAVGDLHVENFGTWRDIEGRLIWGINDFDEACYLPYLLDIVRLLTSVELAAAEDHIRLPLNDAIGSFLAGYREHLECGGCPIVLAEQHAALGIMARARLKEPERFWTGLTRLPSIEGAVPSEVKRNIQSMLPGGAIDSLRYVHRVAGLGSLGRRRFVAIGTWRGGHVAREAKEITVSACVWAGCSKGAQIHYQEMIDDSIRCTDPFVRFSKKWLVRRLAPDCSRIELASLGAERDELRLLRNMGRETANIHLATAKKKRLLADLDKRKPSTLLKAVSRMADRTRADWKDWKRAQAQSSVR